MLLLPALVFGAEQTLVLDVSGHCGSCKKRIEKTVKAVDGTSSADWNKRTKKLTVSFDDEKTNKDAIVNAVLKVGHDADGKTADNEAYSNLPDCCQYRDE